MLSRFNHSMQLFEDDAHFDPWVYRFVFVVLLVGLLANIIRVPLFLHSPLGYLLPYAAAPVGIVYFSTVLFILWRKPHRLRFVILVMYLALSIRVTALLIYVLLAPASVVDTLLLWAIGWMPVAYALPFLVFRDRLAFLVSMSTLSLWIILSVVYVALHFTNHQSTALFLVIAQIFAAGIVMIMFVALYGRLRGLYMFSRKSALQMETIANTDFLLQIPNRRALQIELNKELGRIGDMRVPLSIILIDIDHFKEINDKHGHAMGDKILIDMASVILRLVDPSCYFGRWGGEEFLLILPSTNGIEACNTAEEFRSLIHIYCFPVDHVTASFGVAEYRSGDTMDSILKRADDALYKSKRLGRNRVAMVD